MSQPDSLRASAESYYVTGDFYAALDQAQQQLGRSADATLRAEAEAFLFLEARLIDEKRFDDWLDLFAEECLYWIPANEAADPRRAVSIAFDDRRRLEDRVIRLRTGFAHNQMPERRLQHLVSNVEAFEDRDGVRVLASQLVFEHRPGRPLITHIARTQHRLIASDGGWRIAEKRILLINREDGIETPTLL